MDGVQHSKACQSVPSFSKKECQMWQAPRTKPTTWIWGSQTGCTPKGNGRSS